MLRGALSVIYKTTRTYCKSGSLWSSETTEHNSNRTVGLSGPAAVQLVLQGPTIADWDQHQESKH